MLMLFSFVSHNRNIVDLSGAQDHWLFAISLSVLHVCAGRLFSVMNEIIAVIAS